MVLYIRLAKTGSSSLSKVIDNNVNELTPAPQNMVVFNKNKNIYNKKITVIRNPYDRIVSAYHNAINGVGHDNIIKVLKDRINIKTSFKEFLDIVLEFRENYKELGISIENNIHTIPWYDKSRNPEENRLSYEVYWILSHTETLTDSIEYYLPINDMDFIAKFENLDDDYKKLQKIIGTDKVLPHINKSHRNFGYKEYYNDEIYDTVTKMYKIDLDNFGYEF